MDDKTLTLLPPVVSNGQNGMEIFHALKEQKTRLGNNIYEILHSPEFNNSVTKGVTYYSGILRGDEFDNRSRTTLNAIAEGKRRGGIEHPSEFAALLRFKLSDKYIRDLGFQGLIPMHKPISEWTQNRIMDSHLLCIGADKRKHHTGFHAVLWEHFTFWPSNIGFVFGLTEERYLKLLLSI